MTDVIFELNGEGVRALLRSKEAEDVCKSYADKANSKLGEGYIVTTYKGKNRANASVMAVSEKAQAESVEGALIKALR